MAKRNIEQQREKIPRNLLYLNSVLRTLHRQNHHIVINIFLVSKPAIIFGQEVNNIHTLGFFPEPSGALEDD